MMEASLQAYATIIREEKPKTFWGVFRLPKLISIGGLIIGAIIAGWGIVLANKTGSLNDASWHHWARVILGTTIMFLSILYAQAYRAYILRKNVMPMIENVGFNQYELNAIKRIFTWALVYAIAQALLETIKLIIQISSKGRNNN